jgi:GT2 family glycosyltransferase
MELIQLVVVDGCSKDKTLSIINSATSKACMKVETYSDKGEGLGTARQIVVNNAKGKYLIFVDGDVVLSSDFVRNDVKFMEENHDIVVAFGVPMLKDGTLQERTLIATVSELATYAAERSGAVACEATIYCSEALQQVGGFDTKIKGAAEDRDLIARIRLHGMQVSVNETARFFHKQRENLRAFWVEQSWMGYGDHYFNHKHGSLGTFWRKFPAGDFVYALKLASRTYERTHRKLSFLILPQMFFGNIGWWAGFAKGHKDRYGHEK